MAIVSIWKRIGETPLQATERARKEYNITDRGTFTGRLDPMAQGVMISLFGHELERQEYYNSCRKTYHFHAILGISTDSYDAMGNISEVISVSQDAAAKFNNAMLKSKGRFRQQLPPFSAFRYKGHPLWHHAKHGTLPVQMPCKEREIYELKPLRPPVELSVQDYRKLAISDMRDVMTYNQDKFECVKFIKEWRSLDPTCHIWRLEYEATVSSGTYIRSLVYNIGQSVGIPAHASRITRVSVCPNV